MSAGAEPATGGPRVSATGAVTRGLPAHDGLERWYRRLLLAYPVGYRRAYGDEMLAMLMDAAEPGRRRPARADIADLTRGALRQWFRLPVGRTAVVAAVLAAVVLGATGAATCSWLAWQTAPDLPPDAAVVVLDRTVAGGPVTVTNLDRRDGPADLWRSVSLFDETLRTGWTLEAAQARLRADGWRPGEVYRGDAGAYLEDKPLAGTYEVFEATRDGRVVKAYASTVTTPGPAFGTRVWIDVRPVAPGWEPVAIALGWLVGAVAGWLLTGWAGYRLRRRSLFRRLAASALGLTALGLAAHPTIGLYEALRKLAFVDNGVWGTAPAYRWVLPGPPLWLILGTLLAGGGILVLAATAPRADLRSRVRASLRAR